MTHFQQHIFKMILDYSGPTLEQKQIYYHNHLGSQIKLLSEEFLEYTDNFTDGFFVNDDEMPINNGIGRGSVMTTRL